MWAGKMVYNCLVIDETRNTRGSLCNENPFITPSTNALGVYSISQAKDLSAAVITVHETLLYFSI